MFTFVRLFIQPPSIFPFNGEFHCEARLPFVSLLAKIEFNILLLFLLLDEHNRVSTWLFWCND